MTLLSSQSKRLLPVMLATMCTPLTLAEPTQQPITQAPAAATAVPAPAPAQIKQQISELISQQQYQAAYDLAQQHLAELEGDATFDFQYGFSAAQSGFYNEALFVFERLSNDFPSVPRYRLELARSYYFLGQLDASEREFRQVQSTNPPNQVVSTIDKFLKKIEERRQALSHEWFGQVSYGGGYDSNINSSSDLDQINRDIPGVPTDTIVLNDNQKETSSGFYKLSGFAGYRAPITKRSGFDIRAGGQRKANAKTDDYDLNSIYVDGGFRLIRGYHQWRAGGSYQQYWLADDSLQNVLSGNLSWEMRLAPEWSMSSHVEARSTDNQLNDDLDALQLAIKAGPSYGKDNIAAQFEVVLSSDTENDSLLAKDTYGLNLSTQYALSNSSAYALLAWRQFEYQNKDAADLLSEGKQRSETLLQLVAGYRYQLMPMLGLFGQASYMDNQSNIDIYQYDRLLLEGGVTLSF